jgi:hypothetical protein
MEIAPGEGSGKGTTGPLGLGLGTVIARKMFDHVPANPTVMEFR